MEQRIQLKHPQGKKAVSMEKTKYNVLKKYLLLNLKKKGESNHTELWDGITADFKKNKIKFSGSVQWHLEWVKLDMEANNIIRRIGGNKTQKYTIVK